MMTLTFFTDGLTKLFKLEICIVGILHFNEPQWICGSFRVCL